MSEDELLNPSEISLLSARDCCQALARMAEEYGNKRNEIATYVDEITEAVASIQLLTWESIRVDRFSLTPPELYYEIVGNAQAHLERQAEETSRRSARLACMPEMVPEAEDEAGGAAQQVERHDDVGDARLLPDDKYDIDIDRDFKGFVTDDGALRTVRKPANWNRAIHLASEVLLSEMRTLLETGDGPLRASSCSLP